MEPLPRPPITCQPAQNTTGVANLVTGTNIVVLLTDDQVFDSLHCLGNSLISAPNLDRICTSGMNFRNAHIMGGWAGAVCLPSRTMVMTGR